jgi:hypothetical protein
VSGGPAVALYSGDWRVDAVNRDGVPQFRVRHLGYAVRSHSILRTVEDVRRVMPDDVFAALTPVPITPRSSS